MPWTVLFHGEFLPEYEKLPEDVQDELLARSRVLEQLGPNLGRPIVDTLKGSEFPNMKELRFQCDGVWRFAFAFDPERSAVILVGGDKEDKNSDDFYKDLIVTADRRFTAHIASVKKKARGP
jgi:hypothetical protein